MPRCLICWQKATGIHYGVKSCEGCKAFYKRGLSRSLNYKCYFGKACFDGDCNGKGSSRCKACRFEKCVRVGMNLYAPKRGRRKKDKTLVPCAPAKFHGTPSSNGGQFRAIAPAGSQSKVHSNAVSVIVQQSLTKYREEPANYQAISTLRNLISRDNLMTPELRLPYKLQTQWKQNSDEGFDKSQKPVSNRNFDFCMGRSKLIISDTIRAVADAVKVIYGERFARWNAFMNTALDQDCVPAQPQLTPTGFVAAVTESVGNNARDGYRFLHGLPGFLYLDEDDSKILMMEKWSENWLIVHAPYLLDGESYYVIGESHDIHYSQYWMRQLLDASHIKLIFYLTAQINALKLTQLEYFIFLAVATLHPDTTTASDKKTLTFLTEHYMDCLTYLIQSRCSKSDQEIISERLKKFMRLFRSVYRLGKFYIRSLDYTTCPPFRAIKNAVVVTVEDALSCEQDGLD